MRQAMRVSTYICTHTSIEYNRLNDAQSIRPNGNGHRAEGRDIRCDAQKQMLAERDSHENHL